MLNIKNLHANFGKQQVLRGIDLRLKQGEVLGLIGPNGAGKTSLLRCISGVHQNWQGEITLGDQQIQNLSPRERARRIAVVPQNAPLPAAFTVWESVSLGRTPHLNWLGQLGQEDHDRIDWALKVTQLQDFKERRLGELSGGEQQRALLARALVQDAPILLLDEPTAHLDLHHQINFLNLVSQLATQENLAVLIAIHDLNLAAIYAKHLILLASGKIEASGPVRKVLTTKILQRVYKAPLTVNSNSKAEPPLVSISKALH